MLTLLLALNAHAQCTDLATIDQSTSNGTPEVGDRFGWSLTVGDFNADGNQDLAIGTPNEDHSSKTNPGNFTVHYGGVSGLSGWAHRYGQGGITGMADEDYDYFSSVLAAGDFDNDGYDDLVFGTPEEDVGGETNAGKVAVKFGSSSGLPLSNDSDSFDQGDVVGGGSQDYDAFGEALAVGDFDGDGYDDLAIGVPGEDLGGEAGTGRVVAVFGGPNGLDTSDTVGLNQTHFGLSHDAGDNFGKALAAADFDGDGYDDLAIGIPGQDTVGETDSGQMVVRYGSASGLSGGWHKWAAGAVNAVIVAEDELGRYLAAGDLDNDGYDDLVIGVARKQVNGVAYAGSLHVLLGSSSGLLPADYRILTIATAGETLAPYMYFGTGVAVGDLDDDGYDDIVTATTGFDGSSGRIAAFFGNATATMGSVTTFFGEDCMGGTVEDDELFGEVLAIGDFDGDGRNSLAAGDFSHHVGNDDSAGVVFTAEITP